MRALLVSLDWRRLKDPLFAVGHANVCAALRNHQFQRKFNLFNECLDVSKVCTYEPWKFESFCNESVEKIISHDADVVAFGCFVWNEPFTQKIVKKVKSKSPETKIVLAGPQISYSKPGKLESYYPFADVFVRGYAERPMVKLMTMFAEKGTSSSTSINGVHFAGEGDLGLQSTASLDALSSPFLGENPVINLDSGQRFIRWESQRGCPFKCSFCQHKDLHQKRASLLSERIAKEVEIIKNSQVNDIAVLDPTFNSGPNYLNVLDHFVGYDGKLSLQCRFEMVKDEFLVACRKLKDHGCRITLEFGIQTIIKAESKACRRVNRLDIIQRNAEKLVDYGIPFEISLIYGLPFQTVSSFEESVSFCQALKPKKLVAWPLMLLRGTEMYDQRNEFKLEEEYFDFNGSLLENRIEAGIPLVTSSGTFTRHDYELMKRIAKSL